MFTSIAHAYDINNRLHSFFQDQRWRRVAVRESGVNSAARVLDVACGTGDLAEAFLAAGAAKVVGLDFTPAMLDVARVRANARSLGNALTYLEGDAQSLPFESQSFDIVSIAFGIRNVARTELALAEFFRVLAPGGRLVILELGEPQNRLLRAVNRFFTHRVMPLTASIIARDRSGAYSYLPRSVETYFTPSHLQSLVALAGFESPRQVVMAFGVCVATIATKPITTAK